LRTVSRRAAPRLCPFVAHTCLSTQVDFIITDVDGTLLNHKQELTPKVETAVAVAANAGVPLVVATGKAIGPWTEIILPRLATRLPQISLQGLVIRDYEHGIIYSRELDHELLLDAISFADKHCISLVCYSSNRILCSERDHHTDRLIFYGEPTPESIGRIEPHVGSVPIMKVIFMADEERIAAIRPLAKDAFAGRGALTTAIPGMLELLPAGASKGVGVSWLLDRLGVDPARCMALGDGENDVEMLQLVGLGVAVGNAAAKVKETADVVVGSNDQDGVAEAIERYVLAPRGLSLSVRGNGGVPCQ